MPVCVCVNTYGSNMSNRQTHTSYMYVNIYVEYSQRMMLLTTLPVDFIDGITSHRTFNNQIRARDSRYFWHFAYVRQSIDVHFGAVRDPAANANKKHIKLITNA